MSSIMQFYNWLTGETDLRNMDVVVPLQTQNDSAVFYGDGEIHEMDQGRYAYQFEFSDVDSFSLTQLGDLEQYGIDVAAQARLIIDETLNAVMHVDNNFPALFGNDGPDVSEIQTNLEALYQNGNLTTEQLLDGLSGELHGLHNAIGAWVVENRHLDQWSDYSDERQPVIDRLAVAGDQAIQQALDIEFLDQLPGQLELLREQIREYQGFSPAVKEQLLDKLNPAENNLRAPAAGPEIPAATN